MEFRASYPDNALAESPQTKASSSRANRCHQQLLYRDLAPLKIELSRAADLIQFQPLAIRTAEQDPACAVRKTPRADCGCG